MNPSVYILYSPSLDQFYIGQSLDVTRRLEEHNGSVYPGSFTSKACDWELFYVLECKSTKQSILIEAHIKRMKKREYYINLQKYPEISNRLLIKYSV